MRAIRTGLQGADIPVENSKGEADAGQEEINVRYADALTMADRHVIIKNGCKEIAWSKGPGTQLHGAVERQCRRQFVPHPPVPRRRRRRAAVPSMPTPNTACRT